MMRQPSFTKPDYSDDVFQRQLFQLALTLHDEVIRQGDHWNILADLEDACFSAEESVWGFTPLNIDIGNATWPVRAAVPAQDNVVIILHLKSFEDRVRFMAASIQHVATALKNEERSSQYVQSYSDTLHAFADLIGKRSRTG